MKSLNRSIQLLLLVMGVSITGQVLAETEIKDDQYIIFYHNDALGSPAVVTDHNGNTLWHEQSEPFGRARDRVMTTGKEFFNDHTGSRIGYTGHLKDSGSDLIYMKARFYDPVIGRFYSNDPVGFTETNPMMFNRYAYANNNSYKYTDPTGMVIEIEICGGNVDGNCDGPRIEEDRKNEFDWSIFGSGEGENDEPSRRIPGTEQAHESATIWAHKVVNTSFWNNPFEKTAAVLGLGFSSLWANDKNAMTTTSALTLGRGFDKLRVMMGPARNWVRYKASYSIARGVRTKKSLSLGAGTSRGSQKYLNEIPSPFFRQLNRDLRRFKFPGNGNRTIDPGHFHVRF